MNGAPLEQILSRLSKVSRSGTSFLACCPAHDDHHPSLKITETDDAKILLKCWTGCTASEIVRAIGLEMHDLFPETAKFRQRKSRKYKRLITGEMLEHAQLVVQIGENWGKPGIALTERDLEALAKAKTITNVYGRGDDAWMYTAEPHTDQVEKDGGF